MQPSPFLQMLLNRKRNDPSIYNPNTDPKNDPNLPYDDPNDPVAQGRTIAIRPRVPQTDAPIDKISALGEPPPAPILRKTPWQVQSEGTFSSNPNAPNPYAQQPTVPVPDSGAPTGTIPLSARPSVTQGIDMNAPDVVPAATIPLGPRPAGSIADPFASRPRRTQPRDIIADDRQYLEDVQNKPRSKWKAVLEGLGEYAASGVGLPLHRLIHPGGSPEERAQAQLDSDLKTQKEQGDYQDQLSTIALRNKTIAKMDADLAAKTTPDNSDEIDRAKEMLKVYAQTGFDLNDPKAVIDKARIEKVLGYSIPSNYGPRPKLATERVPTKGTMVEKGITYQTEYDPETKRWVKSLNAAGEPIVEADAPVEKPDRVGQRQQQEDERKRVAYGAESQEWTKKEQTYRQNKTGEDQSIKEKQSKIRDLYAEKRSWTPQLFGGRSTQEIQSDIDRLSAEIKTHRTNSQAYQKQADDASGKATAARRNAGVYSGGGSAPARTAPTRGTRTATEGQLDPKIAVQRAATRKGSALTPDEESAVRAEVDRRNKSRQ